MLLLLLLLGWRRELLLPLVMLLRVILLRNVHPQAVGQVRGVGGGGRARAEVMVGTRQADGGARPSFLTVAHPKFKLR